MLKPGMYPLKAVQELEKKLPNLETQDIENLETHAQQSSSIEVRERMCFLRSMIKDLLSDYGDGTGIFTYLGHEGNVMSMIRLIDDCIDVFTPLAETIQKLRARRDEEIDKFNVLMRYLSGLDKM